MNVHLYLSLIPEALIVSMLPPDEFGQYYATGHHYKSKGQAIFFELDPTFRHEFFDISSAIARCVPHSDGSPKSSVYISVYRVLEHIPVSVIGKLYLSTAYGQTLALSRNDSARIVSGTLHMYQDLAPVNSLVVSTLAPMAHYASVTNKPAKFIRFPALCFVELGLGQLAANPAEGSAAELPYTFINHLREALILLDPVAKTTKLVHRVHSLEFPYRMVRNGFFIGNGPELAYYPMPSHDTLRLDHSSWWRLANL